MWLGCSWFQHQLLDSIPVNTLLISKTLVSFRASFFPIIIQLARRQDRVETLLFGVCDLVVLVFNISSSTVLSSLPFPASQTLASFRASFFPRIIQLARRQDRVVTLLFGVCGLVVLDHPPKLPNSTPIQTLPNFKNSSFFPSFFFRKSNPGS